MRSINFILVILAVSNLNCIADAKKIVCYYGTWAFYREGNGQFSVNDIDPNLCTHLMYAFFGITDDGTVEFLDPYLDLSVDDGLDNIAKVVALKLQNPYLKIMASIGGYNEGSATFSTVAASEALRVTFAQNVVTFCKLYGFDGADIDWEYPASRDGNVEIDKENFVLLLEELHKEFSNEDLLLSGAFAAAEGQASISYDIPGICKYLDFINVMTYDLHGPWDSQTGHNAPLYASANDVTLLQKQLNDNASINYWLSQGAPSEKLVLGMPFYGHTFTLVDPSENTVGSNTSGPGLAGPYTQEPGVIGYNELCEIQLTEQWNRRWDSNAMVPYTYKDDQWISYDDAKSIALKVKFAVAKQLGGVMIWSIENDDFRGICNQGKYPLLNTINRVLRETKSKYCD